MDPNDHTHSQPSELAEAETPLVNATAPRTPAEEIIADIWKRSLGIDKLGIYDDFFDLAPSPLAIDQTLAEIERVFNVRVSSSVFLRFPTIREFTDLLSDIWGGREIVDEIAWARMQVMEMRDSSVEELLKAENDATEVSDEYDDNRD